jgi:hypothetical protein
MHEASLYLHDVKSVSPFLRHDFRSVVHIGNSWGCDWFKRWAPTDSEVEAETRVGGLV